MPVSPARKRWLDSHRAQLNADSHQRRAEARANGLCIQCLNEDASPDHSTCEGCRKGNRQRMKRVRNAARCAGICTRCRVRPACGTRMRGRKKLCRLYKRRARWCETCRNRIRHQQHQEAILQRLVDGPFTVIELAAAFKLTQRTMLRRIKPVLGAELIERWVRDDDAGYTWLRLTQKGWRTIRKRRR